VRRGETGRNRTGLSFPAASSAMDLLVALGMSMEFSHIQRG
jgi:hypothetical protein